MFLTRCCPTERRHLDAQLATALRAKSRWFQKEVHFALDMLAVLSGAAAVSAEERGHEVLAEGSDGKPA